ncbi:hypothetical protein DB88DRAFT_497586 [Papiliotrema laurentii]|uniref:RRM domain-containing protein n=1 Tax=Papiliotrema laurentii TaxID=5418 RepID=A0AAD9CX21_PAPLA|nr:hypothetical protein DB88DRAFT_497586 [Papiliotrema laurentii]
MDIDKPLDDLISGNRKPRGGDARGGRGGPRRSDRGPNSTPYARPPPRSTEEKWVHDAYTGGGRAGRGGRAAPSADVTRVAGTGAGFTGLSPRIKVVGLHYEVTPADLKTIFSQAGTLVQGPTISYDRSGRSLGEAVMEFASPQQAKIAINKFDGAMTKGQTISIHLLPPATAGRPGRQSRSASGSQTGASLLSRIQGVTQTAPAGRGQQGRGNAGGQKGGNRGRGGRGGAAASAGGGRGGRRPPASGEDLDKQLDSFMAGGETAAAAPAPAGAEDVQMS